MKTTIKQPRVTKSSGNVFADLGVRDPQDALARAKLAARIADIIRERGLSQTKAAQILELDQPKVSALVRGKLEGFSADRLFRLLNALGQEVEITIRPAKRARGRGAIRVVAAAI